MKYFIIIRFLGDWLPLLLERQTLQKGTIRAYKSCKKKVCSDFQGICRIHLHKEGRIPKSALLCIPNCKSADDVFINLANSERHKPHTRLTRIWKSYELIHIA